ncbi:transcription termination/antitermination protein NusA [Mycoplasma mycoides subsp. capri]|nr:transcription termination/antitermination protein NusA [Mycoplasma mycoides subsp. capri]
MGIVEIKAVSREPGKRSKVAVITHNNNVEPIGA